MELTKRSKLRHKQIFPVVWRNTIKVYLKYKIILCARNTIKVHYLKNKIMLYAGQNSLTVTAF
jgi:hypothetical protein